MRHSRTHKMFIYLSPSSLCCILRGSLKGQMGPLAAAVSHLLPYSLAQIIEIIQCRMCHIQFPRQKCSRGRGLCIAVKEEACTTGRIFKYDGTLWLTFRGCLKNCANVNNIKWSVYLVNFRCCRSHDLCNEDI
uniref:Prostate and testis expressed 1 n=2 Tax=Bos TaxID=9903 RepID=A0A3Q1LRW3_BOVIN